MHTMCIVLHAGISHALFRLILPKIIVFKNNLVVIPCIVSNNFDPDQEQRIVGYGFVQTVFTGYLQAVIARKQINKADNLCKQFG